MRHGSGKLRRYREWMAPGALGWRMASASKVPVPAASSWLALPARPLSGYVRKWQSAIGCGALVAAVLLSAPHWLLLHGTGYERIMRIHTARPGPVAEAIRQAAGRDATQLTGYTISGGLMLHRLQLVISRLEVVSLTDLIHALDPDAIVDVFPIGSSRGPGTRVPIGKRHSRADLSDVSKYSNEL